MMWRKIGILVLFGLLVLLLSACGGNEKAGDSGPVQPETSGVVLEPCTLISMPEAEELMGADFTAIERSEEKRVGLKLCMYFSEGEDEDRFLQISLTQAAFMEQENLDRGQSPQSIFEAIKTNFEEELVEENIGDEAFIATPGLHILKDGYYIVIGVGNTSDENNREILRRAGNLAVSNLEAALQ